VASSIFTNLRYTASMSHVDSSASQSPLSHIIPSWMLSGMPDACAAVTELQGFCCEEGLNTLTLP